MTDYYSQQSQIIKVIQTFLSRNNQICKSNSYTRETVELAKLPENFIATDFHWYNSRNTGSQSAGGSGNNEALLISSNDGRFIILNKGIRMEKNISAHSMAIVSGRWSTDGAGLFTGNYSFDIMKLWLKWKFPTASEDGVIKIWSRSGMLRSTVVQSTEPIITACWSPNSSAIAFCQGGNIAIKPLAANSKLSKVCRTFHVLEYFETYFFSVESSWRTSLMHRVVYREQHNRIQWRRPQV